LVTNKVGIFGFWFEPNISKRIFENIPLTYFGIVLWGIFNTFAFLAWYSHVKSAFADPGIVSSHLVPPDEGKDIQMCEKCKPK